MRKNSTPEDLRNILAQNVRIIRKLRNLTQEELGLKLKIHRTELSAIERGRRSIKLSKLVLIANSLRIHPASLLEPELKPEILRESKRAPLKYYSKILSENIYNRRLEIKKTQIDLEIASGIPQAQLSRFENGKGNIELDTIWLLTKALKILPSDLFKENQKFK